MRYVWEAFWERHGPSFRDFLEEDGNFDELLETGSITYKFNGKEYVIGLVCEQVK